MTRKQTIFSVTTILALLALAVGIFFAVKATPRIADEAQSPSVGEDPASPPIALPNGPQSDLKPKGIEKVVYAVERALNTPISFRGRVEDQNGEAVPDATVRYSVLDRFNASGGGGETKTDSKGVIEISGVNGAVLGVNVSKDGYYQIAQVSNQRFAYGLGPDDYTKLPPTEGEPAVFVLHKKGKTEPLIKLPRRQFEIPRDGTPRVVDLSAGKQSGTELHVKCWVGESKNGKFDWRFELAVVGGGLVERDSQFEFTAPHHGYEETIKVGKTASDPAWTIRAEKDFFIRFKNGIHARISARFYPRDYRSIIVLESYLNPEPRQRNLEFDSERAIDP